jgi:hypothetical protein
MVAIDSGGENQFLWRLLCILRGSLQRGLVAIGNSDGDGLGHERRAFLA